MRDLFFFQAEDGIRDVAVTGVQTCALPISSGRRKMPALPNGFESSAAQEIFPGPLHHHALQLQFREPSERFPGGDLRAVGEVVYMSRGPLVQKSPQFDVFGIEDLPIAPV